MSNGKNVATFSILLGILTMLTIHSQLGQPIYAPAHTSGYNRGCSDAQISDPSERYINQPGKGSDFILVPLCRHIMKALMLVGVEFK